MIDKNYFQFYETFYATIDTLPNKEQLKYFKAICRYGLFGEQPQFSDKKDLAIFLQIQFAIDNQNKRRAINRENGSFGGRPKAENNRQKPNKTDKKQNAELNRIEMKGNEEKENSDSDESSDFEKSLALSQNSLSSKRFVKPSLKEIQEYCRERRNSVNAENFFDFYESKGWLVGQSKMKDWRACVRTWEKKTQSARGTCGHTQVCELSLPTRYISVKWR